MSSLEGYLLFLKFTCAVTLPLLIIIGLLVILGFIGVGLDLLVVSSELWLRGLISFLKNVHDGIDLLELCIPCCIIQELSEVKSIVVISVGFTVVARRQHRHLVSTS